MLCFLFDVVESLFLIVFLEEFMLNNMNIDFLFEFFCCNGCVNDILFVVLIFVDFDLFDGCGGWMVG